MKRKIVINKKKKMFWECREYKADFWKSIGLKVKEINGLFKLFFYIKFLKMLRYDGSIYIDGEWI
jgi:hypothetical protein